MQEQRNKVLTERIATRWVRLHTSVVLFFLIAPILAIIPLSFNSGSYFSYPMQGFSFRWYEQALTSARRCTLAGPRISRTKAGLARRFR